MKPIAVAAWLVGAAVLVLAGCSFDKNALVFGDAPSRDGSRSGSAGGADDDGPSAGSSGGPTAADGGSRGDDAAVDADASQPQDGATGPEGDGGSDAGGRDTGAPGCPEVPACACGHTRLMTPEDPCAAPDCPLADCAPDEDCALTRFGSSTYYVCSNARSQEDAAARCAQIGMHLIFVDSREEDEFIYDSIEGKVWIGAVEAGDGVWAWLDGTPFYDDEPIEDAYVNWDDSVAEPNGLGLGIGDVTCAIAWSDTEAWADTNCPSLNGYVCELEL